MVSGIIPVMHQIPCNLLMSVNDEALTRHFLGILELVPGAEALLVNNPLKRAHWSLNRDILHCTFSSPIDDNLRAMTHHAFRKFFNVSDDSEPVFIECPTISSIKWASVPCYDADNKEISEHQLADQILHQGLFAELKVIHGPIWIVPSTGNKGLYTMVKLDFEDNRSGSNLKILLNKNIFLNGKVCHTLPLINQNSTPQCTQCLHWGHSGASCQTNFSYCTICSGCHMTSNHQNSCLRGETSEYELACINCLAAGMTHTHKATDKLCPFFIECNNKQNITQLLATIRSRRLEGFENPFGLTKVHHSSSSSYESSVAGCQHAACMGTGNYPTQFLKNAVVISSQSASSSLNLASSNDSLFRHMPNISASQAARASIVELQDATTSI